MLLKLLHFNSLFTVHPFHNIQYYSPLPLKTLRQSDACKCTSHPGHLYLMWLFLPCWAPSYSPEQHWLLVDRTFTKMHVKTPSWNMSAILFRPRCVNPFGLAIHLCSCIRGLTSHWFVISCVCGDTHTHTYVNHELLIPLRHNYHVKCVFFKSFSVIGTLSMLTAHHRIKLSLFGEGKIMACKLIGAELAYTNVCIWLSMKNCHWH